MSLGLVGRKVGMTRVFTDDGDTIPVTVVDVSDNRVTQIKTPETDGYAAVPVTYGRSPGRRGAMTGWGSCRRARVRCLSAAMASSWSASRLHDPSARACPRAHWQDTP